MSAPTSDPTWDSGNVHTTPTTAGLKASGFGSNEIPASDCENYWRKSVADWIAFLNAQIAPRWRDNIPRGDLSSVTFDNTTASYKSSATGTISLIPIDVFPGMTITDLRACVDRGGNNVDVYLNRLDGSGITQIGHVAITTGSGFTSYSAALGSPEPVPADGKTAYEMVVAFTNANQYCRTVGVKAGDQ